MSKKKIFLIAILVIIAVLCFNIAMVFAASKNELENESDDLQQKIDAAKGELSQIEDDLTETMKQIRKLNTQISGYETEIEDLDGEIEELEGSIENTNTRLKEAEKKFVKQEQSFENRMVAMYEAGESTYLDVLLSSSGFADFISNYYLVSEIATYDTELLDQMEENKNEIKSIKTELEKAKGQVESIIKTKVATQNALKDSQDVKEDYAAKLSEDEKEKKKELEQFEADKREIERELAALTRPNYPSYIPGNPSASGYIFPVAGLGIYNINNRNYPSYSGHTGVDININVVGKSIVAVKSGEVVTSTAMKYSNGRYKSYGEYVVIDHNDGTMTLYAHGLANSRVVERGQQVKQGQVLMTVGSTGNSTGPHLHFEVRIGGRCVNPIPYL